MRKLIFILLLFPVLAFGQTPVSPVTFNTLNDLRAQVGTPNVQIRLSGLTSSSDQNGGDYMWDAASTVADDGFITVRPNAILSTDPGRWRRIGNSNTLKGSYTGSALSLTTSYVVAYPTALTFVPITVIVIPRTAAAAQISYITNITNTSFTINFLTVPVLGTNNLVFDYIIVKQ